MGRIKLKKDIKPELGFKENTFNRMRKEGEIRQLLAEDEVVFKGLSREYFEQRNVHENRILAQKIGVESATTLSKTDLLNKIIEKVWGLQNFDKGYKEVGEIDVNSISAELELEILEEIKRGEVVIGEETEGIFVSKGVGGVLYTLGDSYNDIIVDTCVLRNLVGEFSLSDGDYVRGRVKYYQEAKCYCLYKIDEINGKKLALMPRDEINSKQIEPSKILPLKGSGKIVKGLSLISPVCYGQFGLVTTNGRANFTEMASEIYQAVDDIDCEKILFVLGEKERNIESIQKQVEPNGLYVQKIGDKNSLDMVKIILTYASRQARDGGKKIVVVINDVDTLDKQFNANGVSLSSVASCAGLYDNGGSVTIIGIASTVSPMSQYYDVRNVLDFELSLKSGADVTQNTIDVLGSYSFSAKKTEHEQTQALAVLKQIALTEGAGAVDRILSDKKSVKELIKTIVG